MNPKIHLRYCFGFSGSSLRVIVTFIFCVFRHQEWEALELIGQLLIQLKLMKESFLQLLCRLLVFLFPYKHIFRFLIYQIDYLCIIYDRENVNDFYVAFL